MNREEIDDLIQRAEKFINKEIPVTNSITENYVFIGISRSFGIAEQSKELKYKIPYGILKSSTGKIEKIRLDEIVKYFENQSNVKQD